VVNDFVDLEHLLSIHQASSSLVTPRGFEPL
jgi:hypothetical protein